MTRDTSRRFCLRPVLIEQTPARDAKKYSFRDRPVILDREESDIFKTGVWDKYPPPRPRPPKMAAMRRTSGDGSFLRSLNEVAVLRALRETGTPDSGRGGPGRAAVPRHDRGHHGLAAAQRLGGRGRGGGRRPARAAGPALHLPRGRGARRGGRDRRLGRHRDGRRPGRGRRRAGRGAPEPGAVGGGPADRRAAGAGARRRRGRRAAEPAGLGRRRHHRRHRQRGPGAQERRAVRLVGGGPAGRAGLAAAGPGPGRERHAAGGAGRALARRGVRARQRALPAHRPPDRAGPAVRRGALPGLARRRRRARRAPEQPLGGVPARHGLRDGRRSGRAAGAVAGRAVRDASARPRARRRPPRRSRRSPGRWPKGWSAW